MQLEVNEFMQYVKREMVKGLGDWEQRLSTALVKSSPSGLVRAETRHESKDVKQDDQPEHAATAPASAVRTKATRDA
jgi:hypothetical protein